MANASLCDFLLAQIKRGYSRVFIIFYCHIIRCERTLKKVEILKIIGESGQHIREIFLIQLKIIGNVRHFICDVVRKLVCAEFRGQWTPVWATGREWVPARLKLNKGGNILYEVHEYEWLANTLQAQILLCCCCGGNLGTRSLHAFRWTGRVTFQVASYQHTDRLSYIN